MCEERSCAEWIAHSIFPFLDVPERSIMDSGESFPHLLFCIFMREVRIIGRA